MAQEMDQEAKQELTNGGEESIKGKGKCRSKGQGKKGEGKG